MFTHNHVCWVWQRKNLNKKFITFILLSFIYKIFKYFIVLERAWGSSAIGWNGTSFGAWICIFTSRRRPRKRTPARVDECVNSGLGLLLLFIFFIIIIIVTAVYYMYGARALRSPPSLFLRDIPIHNIILLLYDLTVKKFF